MNAPLLPGWPDPVDDAQTLFRQLLDALAHPGRIHTLHRPLAVPAPLAPAAGAVALTLCDFETPVWLQSPEAAPWLRFHCACPLVDAPATARFVFIDQPAAMPPLSDFAQGEPEYPDRSATLVLQVASLTGHGLTLSGPGIAGTARLGVSGLPAGFWDDWRAQHARFPLGVDLILVAGERFAALPRTTRVEVD